MKKLYSVLYGLFVILLLAVAVLFLAPLLPISGNVEMKIVQSGSMEPSIATGALVLLRPAPSYSVGDVITFTSASADIPTTHRIVGVREELGQVRYATKGDANEEADTDEVLQSAVLGRVMLDIPYAGFVFDFARQPLGFILLIALPALLIVFDEIDKIWKEMRRLRRARTPKDPKDGGGSEMDSDNTLRMKEVVAPLSPVRRMMDIRRPETLRVLPLSQGVSMHPVITEKKGTRPVTLQTSHRDFAFTSSLVLLVSALIYSMGTVGSTVSYFSDIESSIANYLRAGSLDFTVEPEVASATFVAGVGASGAIESFGVPPLPAPVQVSVSEPDNAGEEISYSVKVVLISGSELFCNDITAATELPFTYLGPLLDLTATGIQFSEPWNITATQNTSVAAPGDACIVDVVYTGVTPESEGGGYTDEERVRLEFYAGDVPDEPVLIPSATSGADSDTTLSEGLSTTTETLPIEEGGTEKAETEDAVVPLIAPLQTSEEVDVPSGEEEVSDSVEEIPEATEDDSLTNTTEETAPSEPISEAGRGLIG